MGVSRAIRKLFRSEPAEAERVGAGLHAGDRHYRAFVGPPARYDQVAAMQFNLLTTQGLRDHHTLLDIGCGSLRLGRLAIPYLRPGRYFGLEPERWLIEEGIDQECGRDLVRLKKPRFRHDSDFSLSAFGVRFDYLIAQSIFTHAAPAQIGRCLAEARRSMHADSLFLANYISGSTDYDGNAWVYPGCVTYSQRRMVELAVANGLSCTPLEGGAVNGTAWLCYRLPGSEPPERGTARIEAMPETAKDTPLLVPVLGMHRSGTSCLMRTLHQAGLHLGDDLINEGHADNLEGYWESRSAVAINNRILEQSGGSWRHVPAGLQGDGATTALVREFLATLLVRPVAGWKDPRTCLTFQLWRPLLANYHLVACFRHPLSVARSLQARDGIPIEEGLRLWKHYNECILRITENEPRVSWVDYDATPAERTSVLAALCRELGLRWDASLQQVFNPCLRHHEAAEMPADPEVAALYETLRHKAREQHAEHEPAVLATNSSTESGPEERWEALDSALKSQNQVMQQLQRTQRQLEQLVGDLETRLANWGPQAEAGFAFVVQLRRSWPYRLIQWLKNILGLKGASADRSMFAMVRNPAKPRQFPRP